MAEASGKKPAEAPLAEPAPTTSPETPNRGVGGDARQSETPENPKTPVESAGVHVLDPPADSADSADRLPLESGSQSSPPSLEEHKSDAIDDDDGGVRLPPAPPESEQNPSSPLRSPIHEPIDAPESVPQHYQPGKYYYQIYVITTFRGISCVTGGPFDDLGTANNHARQAENRQSGFANGFTYWTLQYEGTGLGWELRMLKASVFEHISCYVWLATSAWDPFLDPPLFNIFLDSSDGANDQEDGDYDEQGTGITGTMAPTA